MKQKRFAALHYRDFRFLWGGQFVSNIGNQMMIVALNWHIYTLTKSPLALGILGLSRFLPIVIFALIAGNFADSHNRKKIMLFSQVLLGIVSVTLALLTFTNNITPMWIYVLTAIASVLFAFDSPARQAFIPQLVDKKHLANAMSMGIIMWQTTAVVGPALSGFLIAEFGVGGIYTIDAVSFAAVILSILLIRTKGKVAGERIPLSFGAIWEGLVFVKGKTLIWSTMLLDFFSTLFSSAYALLPIFAQDILHVGPQGLGILFAAPAIGAVVAGFIMAHMEHIKKQGVLLLASVALYGAATVLFGLSKSFALSLFALFLVGFGDSISSIIRNTVRQIVTPNHIRGRMTSVNMIFYMGGPQLGEFEAGVLASAVGGPMSVVIGGIGTLVAVGVTAYFIPALRKYKGDEVIA